MPADVLALHFKLPTRNYENNTESNLESYKKALELLF